jgi:hypothetical protein
MRLNYEIVQLFDGHLFDAESYERTSVTVALTERESGYYLVLHTPDGQESCAQADLGSIGPFRTVKHATLAFRDLQLRNGAIERGPEGSPSVATASREPEAIS